MKRIQNLTMIISKNRTLFDREGNSTPMTWFVGVIDLTTKLLKKLLNMGLITI